MGLRKRQAFRFVHKLQVLEYSGRETLKELFSTGTYGNGSIYLSDQSQEIQA